MKIIEEGLFRMDDGEHQDTRESEESWDLERRPHELNDLEMSLTETDLYIPARTKWQMDQDNGAPVLALKTKSYPESGAVRMAAAQPGDRAARRLRLTETMGAATLGFGIPLRKLGLSIPAGRKLVFKVKRLVTDNGVHYEISFNDAANLPREQTGSQAAAAKQPEAEAK